MSLRVKYIAIFSAVVFSIAALLYLTGCSGIQLDQKIKIEKRDWVMAGGSPEQQHNSGYTLAPPLNLMWEYNIEGGVGTSGIAVTDAVVFVNALQGEMYTFDVASGGKIGKLTFLGKDVSTSPLILGNNVIITYAGDKEYSLASYNMSSSEINWRKNYSYVQTSPIFKDGFIYFGSLYGTQYKVDVKKGSRIWHFETRSPIHSTCAVSGDKVVFGNDDGTIYCLSTITGEEVWRYETSTPVISTPMIDSSIVYLGADDSNFYAIDISDGSLIWKNNMHTKIIGGSSLFQSRYVIFGCVDGNIYSLDKTYGTIKWKFTTFGTVTSTPLISGDFIYVTSYDGNIYCLDAHFGKVLWSSVLENKSKTTPIVWKEYLFVAADNLIYCFTSKNFDKKK